jgi:hypothetical protein
MPQFILKINLGNDGMCRAHQLADAIETAAYRVRHANNYNQVLPTGEIIKIRDINGNVCGEWKVE